MTTREESATRSLAAETPVSPSVQSLVGRIDDFTFYHGLVDTNS